MSKHVTTGRTWKQTLGYRPIMPKNLLGHGIEIRVWHLRPASQLYIYGPSDTLWASHVCVFSPQVQRSLFLCTVSLITGLASRTSKPNTQDTASRTRVLPHYIGHVLQGPFAIATLVDYHGGIASVDHTNCQGYFGCRYYGVCGDDSHLWHTLGCIAQS